MLAHFLEGTGLAPVEAEALFAKVIAGKADAAMRELFRGQMLTEMAGMAVDDGMTMQLHPGSWRNHNPTTHEPVDWRFALRRHPEAAS